MSRPAAWAFVVLGFLGLGAVPIVSSGGAARAFAVFADGLSTDVARLEAAMDDFERGLEDASALRAVSLGPVQHLTAGWGGAGNEQVYVGRWGFLFYRPGVDTLTGPPLLDPDVLERRRRSAPAWEEPPEPDPRPALLDFARQLDERGIVLVVLLTPTKAQLHSDVLGFDGNTVLEDTVLENTVLENAAFDELRATLQDAGVRLFDAVAPLVRLRENGGRPFLLTDSHWTPSGVDAVARDLAAELGELGVAWEGAETEYERFPEEVSGTGDLAKMLRLPLWSELYPPERVRRLRVVNGGEGEAEVLLLGDSFSNVFSDARLGWGDGAGLGEQLAFHLRRPVDRLALNDGSATAVRQRLAENPGRLAGKKVVVYQVAVRELAFGDWRVLPRLPAS